MDKIINNTKRVTAVILIISMVLPIVSCNNIASSGKETRKVFVDSPWFNGDLVNVDLGLDNQRTIGDMFPTLAGADEKYIVVFSDGEYKVDDWGKVKSNADFAIKKISVIDRSTKKLVKIIDLYSIIKTVYASKQTPQRMLPKYSRDWG